MPVRIHILCVIASVLHSTYNLYDLIKGIQDPPQEIKDVSAHCKAICHILHVLRRFFAEKRDPELLIEIVDSLYVPLEKIIQIVEEMIKNIKPMVPKKGELKKS